MTIDTDKLKALALAATPGKWEVDTVKSEGHYGTDEDGGYGFTAYVVTDEKGCPLMDSLNRDDSEIHEDNNGEEHYAWDELAKRDAQYIAEACPATVLALIAEVERLRADAARLDFMITEECQIEHMDRVGAGPVYRVRWPWTYAQQSEWSATPRDAIDKAIAAKEPPCGS
jgi:hypothetical protein